MLWLPAIGGRPAGTCGRKFTEPFETLPENQILVVLATELLTCRGKEGAKSGYRQNHTNWTGGNGRFGSLSLGMPDQRAVRGRASGSRTGARLVQPGAPAGRTSTATGIRTATQPASALYHSPGLTRTCSGAVQFKLCRDSLSRKARYAFSPVRSKAEGQSTASWLVLRQFC